METLIFQSRLWAASLFTLFLCSCHDSGSSFISSNNFPSGSDPVSETDVVPSSLIGVWEKIGYGQINELDMFFVEIFLSADEESFSTKPELILDDAHAYKFNKQGSLPDTCSDDNVFEGVAISVDYLVDFYVPEDIVTGYDTAIKQALSLINEE